MSDDYERDELVLEPPPADLRPIAYTIAITCTDHGQHAPATLGQVIVHDDGSFDTATTRKAALPASGGLASSIGQRVVVNSPNRREDFAGRRRWRFPCNICRRDVPVSDETMRRLVDGFAGQARRVVDLSLLPTG